MPDHSNRQIVAVDYETYYKLKTYSINKQGTWGYLNHPEFDAYLVSVVTEDGDEFCGHPTEFDWPCIEDFLWLSHNKGFDATVHQHLIDTGVIESPIPEEWYCTADLAAYHGIPRSLAATLKYLFKHEMNKGVRDAMSGRQWKDLSSEDREELMEYALEDSRWLIPLWNKLSPTWPEHERRVSNLTIEMKNRGLPTSEEKLDKSLRTLKTAMFKAAEDIPWWDAPTKAHLTPLSNKLMAEECRKHDIPAPKSRAKDDPECLAWLKEHGAEYPFVGAMGVWNSCNTLLKKLEVFRERTITREDGTDWMPYGMKYCSTHTGRDAGGDGFNILNFNKNEVKGVDIRSHILPPPGYKFAYADYSQIEPRILAWVVGDTDFIETVASGIDPYVAFGLSTIGHQGEWTPKDRSLWKVMVLQLGYQSGGEKFLGSAQKEGLEMNLKEARDHVKFYRKKNKLVTDFWAKLQKDLEAACKGENADKWVVYDLPSGRKQIYRDIKRLNGLSALIAGEGGWMQKKLYGGLLTENLTQAMARDVFFDGYLRLVDAEFSIVMRVYDEFLALVKEEEADEKLVEMTEIMATPPPWAPDIPLKATGKILDFYQKV